MVLVLLLCGGGFAVSPGYRGAHGGGLGGVLGLLLLLVVIFLVLRLAGVLA